MKAQIALDILVAFAISGAFALLVASMSYSVSHFSSAQLSSLGNAVARASAALNYSIDPIQEFKIQKG